MQPVTGFQVAPVHSIALRAVIFRRMCGRGHAHEILTSTAVAHLGRRECVTLPHRQPFDTLGAAVVGLSLAVVGLCSTPSTITFQIDREGPRVEGSLELCMTVSVVTDAYPIGAISVREPFKSPIRSVQSETAEK